MRWTAVAWLAAAACTDPAVTMHLDLPTTNTAFDTSCIASLDVYADGTSYKQDNTDFKHACINLTNPGSTFAQVQAALRGQVQLPIPDSGLADIALTANASACNTAAANGGPTTPDVIFYAAAPYDGDDVALTMIPNVSCATKAVKVRLVDLLQLASTHKCSMAAVADAGGGVGLGVLSTDALTGDVFFTGGFEGAGLAGGAAAIANARTQVGDHSCLASFGGGGNLVAMSCVPTTKAVCAQAGELEAAVIDGSTAFMTLDTALQTKFGPPTFAVVWSGVADAGAPVAGATVTLDDPSAGVVQFVGAPSGGQLTKLGAKVTSDAGMFVIYAHGLAGVTVAQGGRSKHIVTGSVTTDPAAMIISLD